VQDRFTISPRAYKRLTYLALGALTLIVFSGAAVRLTGSGLGCPDWPKCNGGYVAPLTTHAWIEYANRLFSGLVGAITIAAGVLAWRRRPFRRDLAVIGSLLPLGIVAQGALGAVVVLVGLRPGFVMGHFGLSMLCLVGALALAWRATYEPGERPRATDAVSVWATRALLAYGALVIFAGMVATAAGPHAGSSGTGEVVDRLTWNGVSTLQWAVRYHARLAAALGVATLVVFFLLWRRGADRQARLAVGALAVCLAAQGITGTIQYHLLNLPTEVVWIHIVGASCAWLAMLWAVAASGRLAPRAAPDPVPARAEVTADEELTVAH
jgi:cytochrome c oxidase assembly protein subunit 15